MSIKNEVGVIGISYATSENEFFTYFLNERLTLFLGLLVFACLILVEDFGEYALVNTARHRGQIFKI